MENHRRLSPPLAGDVSTLIPAQDLARARQSKLGLELVEERPGGLRYKCGNGYFTLFQSAGGASGPIRKWAGKSLTSRRQFASCGSAG
jgi:hypothetical protein